MEGFCRAAAALAAEGGEPDLETVLRLAGQHGIEMLGPIPAAAETSMPSRRPGGAKPLSRV